MIKVFISNNPSKLSEKLSAFTSTATVEADVPGSVLTLAHHGPRSGRMCPCLSGNMPELGIQAIGLSHIDLDTLGGVMAILGRKPEDSCECGYGITGSRKPAFWRAAAALVDTNGVHKLPEDTPQEVNDMLNAFWAWSEKNRLFPPRDGGVEDVTKFVMDAIRVLRSIIWYDAPGLLMEETRETGTLLIEEGRKWAAQKAALD